MMKNLKIITLILFLGLLGTYFLFNGYYVSKIEAQTPNYILPKGTVTIDCEKPQFKKVIHNASVEERLRSDLLVVVYGGGKKIYINPGSKCLVFFNVENL